VPSNPTFELSFKVPEADIDIQGHINNVAFLRYVQDAAVAHWNAVAAADLRTRLTWVVRKHEIEYFRPGLPGDELAVKTWVGEASGATWERFANGLGSPRFGYRPAPQGR
jgi:acyl-CoA thioester hydrolase